MADSQRSESRAWKQSPRSYSLVARLVLFLVACLVGLNISPCDHQEFDVASTSREAYLMVTALQYWEKEASSVLINIDEYKNPHSRHHFFDG